MTIQRHLTNKLNARPYKRPKILRITEKIKENRLIFAQNHQNWSSDDWKQVLWSDESPFELFHSPNRQNDRVWATGSKNIEPIQVKFPGKVMVWGMMSHRALSDLHIVPQRQSVNGAYYRDEMLGKTCLDKKFPGKKKKFPGKVMVFLSYISRLILISILTLSE